MVGDFSKIEEVSIVVGVPVIDGVEVSNFFFSMSWVKKAMLLVAGPDVDTLSFCDNSAVLFSSSVVITCSPTSRS